MALEIELTTHKKALSELTANMEEDTIQTVECDTGACETCLDPSVAAHLGMYI